MARSSEDATVPGLAFADFGVPHGQEAEVKAELAGKVLTLLERRGLSRSAAAELLNVSPAAVTELKRGKLAGFSLEKLMGFLLVLGRDIDIVVKVRPTSRTHPRLRVP